MTDKAKSMVLGSFLGDSLALGVHWIYDQKQIASVHGRLDALKAPDPASYHPTKLAGDFTHYGDQALVLLESLAGKGVFDPADFSARWQNLFRGGYTGYVDKATAATLSQLAAGWEPQDAGSVSDELSGASRIAPLVHVYRNDVEGHGESVPHPDRHDPQQRQGGGCGPEFFARTAHGVLGGSPPSSGHGKRPCGPSAWLAPARLVQGRDGRGGGRLHPGRGRFRAKLPCRRGISIHGAAHCQASGRPRPRPWWTRPWPAAIPRPGTCLWEWSSAPGKEWRFCPHVGFRRLRAGRRSKPCWAAWHNVKVWHLKVRG